MRASPLTQKRARDLCRRLTRPEVALWSHLRRRREGEPAFRRQHPEGPYILDFYCAPARLAVEVDGLGHAMGDQPAHVERRDAWLAEQGIRVERIAASSVLKDADWIAEGLRRLAADVSASHPPPLHGGG